MPSSYRKAVTGFSRSRHAPRDEPGVGLITRSVMATGAAGYYERPTCVGGRLMEHFPSDERLSQISTMWTMLLRAHDTPTDAGGALEAHTDLERAMRHLPEEFRTVLLLAEVDGMPLEEVARVMACPVGTVKSRIFRAKERLRALLKDYETTK